MSDAAYLSIDFGTTQTCAATWVEGEEPQLLSLSGRAAPMPSAVFHDGNDLLIGSRAIRALQSDPLRGERTPKRKLRQYSDYLELGELQIGMIEVVGRILGHVYEQALDAMGRTPDAVCLTRPVTWSKDGKRENILRASAALAGIHAPIHVISEAEAAARELGAKLDVGESCLVYDLGGGTCDIAVMEMSGDGLVLKAETEQEIGGETFDALLLEDVVTHLADRDKEAAGQLAELSEDPLGGHAAEIPSLLELRRCRELLGENVRRAKVRLSTRREAAILVPPPVSLEWVWNRTDYEELIQREVADTVERAEACITQSGTQPTHLYLAGAASATPAVRKTLLEVLSLKPDLPHDPKAATVLGGLWKAAAPLIEAQAKAEARRKRDAAKRTRDAAKRKREEAERQKRAASAMAATTTQERQRAAEEALEKARATILGLAYGKRLSKELLAKTLEAGEVVQYTARCTPPGTTFKKNGLMVLTNHRLLWSRETWTSAPTAKFLRWKDIASIEPDQKYTNDGLREVTVKAKSGGSFKFDYLQNTDVAALAKRV